MAKLAAVVLAAGKGTRMKSSTPKVLFPVANKPMLQHIVDSLESVGVTDLYVVIGHGADQVKQTITGNIVWALQTQQLGTGHALAQVTDELRGYDGDVLVLCGDTPLLQTETISQLAQVHRDNKNAATVLTTRVPDPTGYGRIVRSESGNVTAIVEQKDANSQELEIDEINSGTYCFNWPQVAPILSELTTENAQGEYYLTDIISIANQKGQRSAAFKIQDHQEITGINDRVQLSWTEGIMRQRINQNLMLQGVSIVDPNSTWIGVDVKIGPDTTILPNTYITGNTEIGIGCTIGPNVTIESCRLGDDIVVRQAVMEEAIIGSKTTVGPFAYLRPGTELGQGVKVGDFVEVKNSQIAQGSKIPHLAYVGDAKVGSNTNIGCGVITANYDGDTKSVTEIGNNVFIGSNVNLIAPVKVEDEAYVAAGSTITYEVPAKSLAIARCRQTVKPDWRK